MMYPDNDTQFKDVTIYCVEGSRESGWSMGTSDGWGFFCPADSPIEPRPGMLARFYGLGTGYSVRGLFLNETCVFYRTAVEQQEHEANELYGASAADWLKRWDAGQAVWSLEMGGLGPGYEQCIQIAAAEFLRGMLVFKYDVLADSPDSRKQLEKFVNANPVVKNLGLSGAQWGAAQALAFSLYRDGPRVLLSDGRVEDRKILVSTRFPKATA